MTTENDPYSASGIYIYFSLQPRLAGMFAVAVKENVIVLDNTQLSLAEVVELGEMKYKRLKTCSQSRNSLYS